MEQKLQIKPNLHILQARAVVLQWKHAKANMCTNAANQVHRLDIQEVKSSWPL